MLTLSFRHTKSQGRVVVQIISFTDRNVQSYIKTVLYVTYRIKESKCLSYKQYNVTLFKVQFMLICLSNKYKMNLR